MAEIGLLGGVGDAGHQLEGMAKAPLPAGPGGGDAGADEVLGGEGQHQVDLRVPFQQGLDEQQFGAGAGGTVADLGSQLVEVFLDGVSHRPLAVGGKDRLDRPGWVEGLATTDQDHRCRQQVEQHGGDREAALLEGQQALAGLQHPGIVAPLVRQGLAVAGLGQGRVPGEQGAFPAIDQGEKPRLERR